jgi:hypothetical protein
VSPFLNDDRSKKYICTLFMSQWFSNGTAKWKPNNHKSRK